MLIISYIILCYSQYNYQFKDSQSSTVARYIRDTSNCVETETNQCHCLPDTEGNHIKCSLPGLKIFFSVGTSQLKQSSSSATLSNPQMTSK